MVDIRQYISNKVHYGENTDVTVTFSGLTLTLQHLVSVD